MSKKRYQLPTIELSHSERQALYAAAAQPAEVNRVDPLPNAIERFAFDLRAGVINEQINIVQALAMWATRQ